MILLFGLILKLQVLMVYLVHLVDRHIKLLSILVVIANHKDRMVDHLILELIL